MAERSPIWQLVEYGQSPWNDNLTRALARGGLRTLMERDGIRGVTSNPTIFEKAMRAGTDYDEQLRDLLRSDPSIEDAYWSMVIDDIQHACDLLAPLHDETAKHDGFVSIEVSPDLADDTDATVTQAKEFFARVDRRNVMIKIPATPAGIPAITEATAAGVNVNITLIFSLERYAEVIDAYWTGLERRRDAGQDIAGIHSVASFFVSRVDTETDRRLPDGHPLRGKAAVANAKLAYRKFQESLAEHRWHALAAAGATAQRPLWASTSTKNPAYSPTLYVDELVGRDTVNTLAQPSIEALQTYTGLRPDTVTEGVDAAQAAIDGLAGAGVDFADVTFTLEREGVEAFQRSFKDALATLEKKCEAVK